MVSYRQRRPTRLLHAEDGDGYFIGRASIIYQSARRHIPQDLILHRKVYENHRAGLYQFEPNKVGHTNDHIYRPGNSKRPSITGRGPVSFIFETLQKGSGVQPATESLPPGVRRPEREAHYSHPPGAEF